MAGNVMFAIFVGEFNCYSFINFDVTWMPINAVVLYKAVTYYVAIHGTTLYRDFWSSMSIYSAIMGQFAGELKIDLRLYY